MNRVGGDMRSSPTLYLIIPCYNEEEVLPLTVPIFREKIDELRRSGIISYGSGILFIDDGSKDGTGRILLENARKNPEIHILTMPQNIGQQRAILSGLYEARGSCDIAISLDADGQHDVSAVDDMIDAYRSGYDIVYGIRKSRRGDPLLKRITASIFYIAMRLSGRPMIKGSADFRLVSSDVIEALPDHVRKGALLRTVFPEMDYPAATVKYDCGRRLAGTTKYTFLKMIKLAFNALTAK